MSRYKKRYSINAFVMKLFQKFAVFILKIFYNFADKIMVNSDHNKKTLEKFIFNKDN